MTAISELLTDYDRNAIRRAFGVPPVSGFVSTEGLAGHTRPGGAVTRLATDMCLVELVDACNQPVTDGGASAKVLVTNLHNHTQPLIRYELTDRFIRHPAVGGPYLHARRLRIPGPPDRAWHRRRSRRRRHAGPGRARVLAPGQPAHRGPA
jgi:hypothetical protein